MPFSLQVEARNSFAARPSTLLCLPQNISTIPLCSSFQLTAFLRDGEPRSNSCHSIVPSTKQCSWETVRAAKFVAVEALHITLVLALPVHFCEVILLRHNE
jgi:hypothetical protein